MISVCEITSNIKKKLLTTFYGYNLKLGEFTVVSQPIRLILVDWLYAKGFLFRVRLFLVRFFKNIFYGTQIFFFYGTPIFNFFL